MAFVFLFLSAFSRGGRLVLAASPRTMHCIAVRSAPSAATRTGRDAPTDRSRDNKRARHTLSKIFYGGRGGVSLAGHGDAGRSRARPGNLVTCAINLLLLVRPRVCRGTPCPAPWRGRDSGHPSWRVLAVPEQSGSRPEPPSR